MTSNNQFYITTPIYYVNDKPHIGHAYTTIACDIAARFYRLDGKQVKFLTGTDEHGQKVEKSAKLKDRNPQDFTDEMSSHFRVLADELNCSHDDFIRTTEPRHKKAAQALWQRLVDNGAIYLDKYSGWYSVRDEAYYQESELIDGKAPTGAEVEWVEEESYFFKLSEYQDKLLDFYEQHPDFVSPKSRFNEVINFVRGGKEKEAGSLKDLSISRTTFSWGVPVPDNDKHVMYVWLDALTNYISALGFPDEESKEYKAFWPADMHVVGKDILRFHAVYWPAFLMAAELPLPKKIIAHGWWTNEGQKISKSLGNVIDPFELVEEFGLDQVRYFLFREVPFGNDGNFSRQNLIQRINSDLANNIGNLSQRTLSMVQKNCDGKVPANKTQDKDFNTYDAEGYELLNNIYTKAVPAIEQAMTELAYHEILQTIVAISTAANEYIDKKAPWQLRKEDPTQMEHVLYVLLEAIRCISIMLQPFIPQSAEKLCNQLSLTGDKRSLSAIGSGYALKSGKGLPKPEAIFPRIQEKNQ